MEEPFIPTPIEGKSLRQYVISFLPKLKPLLYQLLFLSFISVPAYYFAKIDTRMEEYNKSILRKVLLVADLNENGILERSELSQMIREIEPDYVFPELNNFLINPTNDKKITIESKGTGDVSIPAPIINIPVEGLEKYLQKRGINY